MARVAFRFGSAHRVKIASWPRLVDSFAISLVACTALNCPLSGFGQVAGAGEALIPARYTPVTDQLGFVWDLHSHGYVRYGTNRVFRNAAVLQINGSSFSASTSLMTADGTHFVLSGSSSNLQIMRRIWRDTKDGTLRYVESILSNTPAPTQVRVTLFSQIDSMHSQWLSDQGKPAGTSLKVDQCGIAAPSNTASRPTVLWFLGSDRGRVKPIIRNLPNNAVRVEFLLTLPPGEWVSIIHGLAQRNLKRPPTASELSAEFAVFHSSKWTGDLPRDLRKTLANVDPRRLVPHRPTGWFGDAMVAATIELGVDRQKDADILVMDEGSWLSGSVEGNNVTIDTRYEPMRVPVAEVAVLVGGAGARRPTRIYLRNGEILNGPVRAEGLRFASDSGITVALNIEQLDALVMRAGQQDGVPGDGVGALIRTYQGDRLAVRFPPDVTIEFATSWFPLALPLGEIAHLTAVREPQPIHRLVTRDGSRLAVILPTGEIALDTIRFGTVRLPTASIREWIRAERRESGGADERGEFGQEPMGPYFELAGDCRLAGAMAADQIDVLTGAGAIVLPIDDLRRFERDEAASGVNAFLFELSNGNTVSGRLATPSVELQALGAVRHVPTHHLVAFEQPPPEPPPSAEQAAPASESSGKPPTATKKQSDDPFADPGDPFGGGESADPFGAPAPTGSDIDDLFGAPVPADNNNPFR